MDEIEALKAEIAKLKEALNQIVDEVETWAINGSDHVEYLECIGKTAANAVGRELVW